jgi:cyclic beta-1,2-glucan synthetase
VHRWVLRHPNVGLRRRDRRRYGGGARRAALAGRAGGAHHGLAAAVLLLALIPAADIAVSVVNQLVTAFLPPRTLPKLDLRPSMAASRPSSARPWSSPRCSTAWTPCARRSRTWRCSSSPTARRNLHFAVLSDFTDAPAETREATPRSSPPRSAGVRALNARYADGRADAFYLFHRPRRWNPRQGVWMGWERKRGKLAEFNRFVRGGAEAPSRRRRRRRRRARSLRHHARRRHGAAAGRGAATSSARSRTRSTAPCTTTARGRVVRGYGILQPRVGVSLPSAHRSRFAAIHSGHPGVDPYTTAVSDVYQDLYGEGSFTGKGIYDVDAFERGDARPLPREHAALPRPDRGQLRARRPRDRHQVYDDYPSRYLTTRAASTAGSAATGSCCAGSRPRAGTGRRRSANRLSLLSRWKMLDNLRRSTGRDRAARFLVAGWTVLPGSPLRWTALGLLAVAAPWIVALLLAALRPPLDRSWRAYYARSAATRRVRAQVGSPSPSCRTRRGSRRTRSCARSGAWGSAGASCSSGRPRRRRSARAAPPRATCGARWRPRSALALRARCSRSSPCAGGRRRRQRPGRSCSRSADRWRSGRLARRRARAQRAATPARAAPLAAAREAGAALRAPALGASSSAS